MYTITPEKLLRFHIAAPRYTSYPTAPEWNTHDAKEYEKKLIELAHDDSPLSLYFHIPFCKTMCLFCGCSVILNRKPEVEKIYIDHLISEIQLVHRYLGKKKVNQLHFGGGTPTKISEPLLRRLFQAITEYFEIDFTKEVAIEIDPRTVVEDQGSKLSLLRSLGFNRVSFGVQDTKIEVQEAIRRRQSLEMTQQTFHQARELGFSGINIDLIYGLPLQTATSFEETVGHILDLRPDRIALFSYAKVPWLKPHQKAIRDEDLPSTEEKFTIYAKARQRFMEAGYVAIGMDHFALEEDEMAKCYQNKTLQRNFQGYTCGYTKDLLGFGVTAISYIKDGYFQNIKELDAYQMSVSNKCFPVSKGKLLSNEDRLRKWVIHTLMCNFEIQKQQFSELFHHDFDRYFERERQFFPYYEREGLIEDRGDVLFVTPLGELFIRNIAMLFDAYLRIENIHPQFSQSI